MGHASQRTVNELVNKYGFPEDGAREALAAISDPGDVQAAIDWLLDNGAEDKGGAVELKHCPHVAKIGYQRLIRRHQLKLGDACLHGCGGDENWICLLCGEIRCGRYGHRHSMMHWQKTRDEENATVTIAEAAAGDSSLGHCLALGVKDLSLWCYECESYVEHETLQPLVKHLERLKFGSIADKEDDPEPAVGSSIPCGAAAAHGRLGHAGWPLPTLARACCEEARPGYKTMSAHEYLDSEEVLRSKVKVVADLIRRSRNCTAYTGAGISTAAGIQDYASKASNSISSSGARVSAWEAQPTLSHRFLVALHSAGHLKHWIQQNHDGLPQKAGYPQRDLNEIHGAWYDPSNPVVPMSGDLRLDLVEKMMEWESRADLCLALGTSMVGMNADRVAMGPAERHRRGIEGALGTVIVALQRTTLDASASVRIFAKLDHVAELLAEELGLEVPPAPPARPWPAPPVLEDLPYLPDGRRATPGAAAPGLRLDLRPGSRLRLANPPEWNRDKHWEQECVVVAGSPEIAREGHIALKFTTGPTLRILGRWWLDAAVEGSLDCLPIIPLGAAGETKDTGVFGRLRGLMPSLA